MWVVKRVLTLSLGLAACAAPTEGTDGPPADARNVRLGWDVTTELPTGRLAVDGSRVYFRDQSGALVALDRTTGAVRWRSTPGALGATVDVLATGGQVVVGAGVLVGFDGVDGSELWRRPSSDGFGTIRAYLLDSLVLPTVHRSRGEAVALSASTGEAVWAAPILPPDSVLGPEDDVRVFAPAGGRREVAYSYNWWKGAGSVPPRGGVALVDVATGQRRWSVLLPPPLEGTQVYPSDADASDEGVVVSTRDGVVHFLERSDGRRRWAGAPLEPLYSTSSATDIRPVMIAGQRVVAASTRGLVVAYDVRTGAELWRRDTRFGAIANLYAGPRGSVLARHWPGSLSLIDVATGSLIWQQPWRGDATAAYAAAISGDSIFLSRPGGVTLWVVTWPRSP